MENGRHVVAATARSCTEPISTSKTHHVRPSSGDTPGLAVVPADLPRATRRSISSTDDTDGRPVQPVSQATGSRVSVWSRGRVYGTVGPSDRSASAGGMRWELAECHD